MKALTYWKSTTIGLVLLTTAAGLMSAAGLHAAAREQPLDRVVAVVNEDVITNSELDDQTRLIEQQIKQQGVQMPPPEVLRKQVLEKMIVDRVQQQIAALQGIKVDDETLNKALANIAKQNNLTLQQFRGVLEKDGYAFADFREQLRGEIAMHRLRQRVIDDHVRVTESEVNDLLTRASPGTVASEYHLAHILITIPEAASPRRCWKSCARGRISSRPRSVYPRASRRCREAIWAGARRASCREYSPTSFPR
jgi:peptidyl-prolyl cis-trans isomerase SurA